MNLKHVTVNNEQQLYVVPEGEGYSCWGFDVCLRHIEALFNELNTVLKTKLVKRNVERGSLDAYNYYRDLCDSAERVHHDTGYRFQYDLEPRLKGLEGKRVEVTSATGKKRRFIVGKSTGFIPIHLEIASKRSSGGGSAYILPTDTIKVL